MSTASSDRKQRQIRLVLHICALGWCLGVLLASPAAASAEVRTERWVWPLVPQPSVVTGFNPPSQPWLAGHRGVDLAGSAGQRVLSSGTGDVTFAGRLAGIGIVVVRTGDLRTTYQPVRATVHVGELVGAGQVIGRVEEFGSHCRPEVCLHWGLLRGHTYLDPLTLVGAGPPRLLPLYTEVVAATPPTRAPVAVGAEGPAHPTGTDTASPSVWALVAGAGAGASLLLATGVQGSRRAPPAA